MAVKILLDPVGNTMNIWWGKPEDAVRSVEVDDPKRNDVMILNMNGKPISLEIVGIFPKDLNVSELTKRFGGKKPEPFLFHT